MREIKFRAFVSDTKKMASWDEICYFNKNGLANIHSYMDEKTPGCECHLMQYTGLKDKNGVEIWEGDIVKHPNKINKEMFGEYSLKEVKYNNGGFLLSYLISEKGQVIPRDYTAGYISNYGDEKIMLWGVEAYVLHDMEVIGNIYSNPELL